MPLVSFPPGFIWGAATSAYQIEGAVQDDGRGESIWDVFCRRPGAIRDGSSGEIACDSYHRVGEDIALMRELGLTSYRFSIAWPRLFPSGSGTLNQPGVDFYRRLVDGLHAAGISPLVTLYHWDLPRPLQSRGGWANRDTIGRFGEFAQVVARALGPEVPTWVTVNEPWVVAFVGHLAGAHAPGLRDLPTALAVAHHLLLAHAEAMEALRAELPPAARVGIALNLAPVEPAGDEAADEEAATRFDGYLNRWFLDALYRGRYPDDLVALYGDAMPDVRPGDMARIASPTDFLGINYYAPIAVRWQPGAHPIDAERVTRPGRPLTAMGWEINADGLVRVLDRVRADYAPPAIFITENGAAFDDRPVAGVVDDPDREHYLRDHLLAVAEAMNAGAPVAGYYVWSLLDNFEWAEGYTKRFGIVYVDYETQTRTIKRSGRWYAGVVRDHAVEG